MAEKPSVHVLASVFWRPHSARPGAGTTRALIAAPSGEAGGVVLLGLYYWDGIGWVAEESGVLLGEPLFWWCDERELVDLLAEALS